MIKFLFVVEMYNEKWNVMKNTEKEKDKIKL